MASRPLPTSRLDRIAMALSGLCAVHCVATAVLFGLLASAGGILGSPVIHEVGLTLAMFLGVIALGRGIREHGFLLPSFVGIAGLLIMAFGMTLHESGLEPAVTILGVLVLALGHRLNMMAKQPSF
ncbi:MAG TPA: MerC domain-containing protein [Sphingomicrobium sp.]|nr:MerC domain-containing protein [Sphingomicrobium sp.]